MAREKISLAEYARNKRVRKVTTAPSALSASQKMANAGSVITSLKLRISSPGAESIYCTAQSGGETSSRDTYAPIPMCSAQDVSKPYKTESVRETLHNHSRSTQWDPLRTSWDDVLSSTQKDIRTPSEPQLDDSDEQKFSIHGSAQGRLLPWDANISKVSHRLARRPLEMEPEHQPLFKKRKVEDSRIQGDRYARSHPTPALEAMNTSQSKPSCRIGDINQKSSTHRSTIPNGKHTSAYRRPIDHWEPENRPPVIEDSRPREAVRFRYSHTYHVLYSYPGELREESKIRGLDILGEKNAAELVDILIFNDEKYQHQLQSLSQHEADTSRLQQIATKAGVTLSGNKLHDPNFIMKRIAEQHALKATIRHFTLETTESPKGVFSSTDPQPSRTEVNEGSQATSLKRKRVSVMGKSKPSDVNELKGPEHVEVSNVSGIAAQREIPTPVTRKEKGNEGCTSPLEINEAEHKPGVARILRRTSCTASSKPKSPAAKSKVAGDTEGCPEGFYDEKKFLEDEDEDDDEDCQQPSCKKRRNSGKEKRDKASRPRPTLRQVKKLFFL